MSDCQFSLKDITVIVAAKNEEKTILKCIQSLLIACKGQAKIILVDDQSSDRTLLIMQKFVDQVSIMNGEGRGPGHARNKAMQQTTSALVAFTDADCMVDPNWLEQLLFAFLKASVEVAGVGGRQLSWILLKGHRIAQFFDQLHFVSNYIQKESVQLKHVSHNPSCNVLYKLDALKDVGGFDEKLWPCEDLDLDIRLNKKGYQFLNHSSAVVYHLRPKNLKELWQMVSRYGFAHVGLIKKHGLCQKIHFLSLLVFVFAVFGFVFPLLMFKFLIISFVSLMVYYFFQSKSIVNALLFSFYSFYCLMAWIYGLARGFSSKMHMARQHG